MARKTYFRGGGFEGDKSPGPDGFSMAFFKVCWDGGNTDLLKAIEDFVHSNFLDYGSNATYISLIPKKERADQICDFRPISLVGSVYKIISKSLADILNKCIISSFLGIKVLLLKGDRF